jgi:preprotein translocase subunit YajC
LGLLVLYVLGFILIFYFMAIRPQQRQRRAHESMVKAVKKGDQVITAGGIVGTVRRTDESFVMLEVAKGVQLKLARRAIAEITSKQSTEMGTEEPVAVVAESEEYAALPEAEVLPEADAKDLPEEK